MRKRDYLAMCVGAAMGALAAGQADAGEAEARAVAETINPNFTLIEQSPHRDVTRFHTGEAPFEGDCDDHAIAAYYQFWLRGTDPELVMTVTRQGQTHVLTCADGWCVDSYKLRGRGRHPVFSESQLKTLYRKVLRRGRVSAGYVEENFK